MTEGKRVIVTRPIYGLAAMQVCCSLDVTDEEILEVCNRENPAGTEMGWVEVHRVSTDRYKWAPVACESSPSKRLHIIVSC